ncbi:DUF1617 family protein [Exiguobacterium sp. s78]|uniref:DUF1617 family protein n=1 Tax=Exiguobacterium sp. s78 TaxID=2751197 RepID=UPI001BE711CB|nr:DUF1617 family protein [Exiguobacterium sp. s78]
MKELTFKKVELEALNKLLLSFKLKGKPSRLRMRIVRLVQETMDEFKKDHHRLIDEYALKDDKGDFVLIKKEYNGEMQEFHDFDDEQGFKKEYATLNSELFIIDTEKYKEELFVILTAIDENEEVLSGQEAIIHDLVYEKISDALA